MTARYAAVFFSFMTLIGYALRTQQLDWIYIITPLAGYTLHQVVKSINSYPKKYRTLKTIRALMTIFLMFFVTLTIMQLDGGSIWKIAQNAILVLVYAFVIYSNGRVYRNGLAIDADIQRWKDEMAARELKWAELYK